MGPPILSVEARRERRTMMRLRTGRSSARLASVKTHGTHGGYSSGCKCDDCTDGEALYTRERNRRRRAAAKAAK